MKSMLRHGGSNANMTARNQWLRSPNVGNANNVRNVNTSGALNNNNANNANALAPDCMKARPSRTLPKQDTKAVQIYARSIVTRT